MADLLCDKNTLSVVDSGLAADMKDYVSTPK